MPSTVSHSFSTGSLVSFFIVFEQLFTEMCVVKECGSCCKGESGHSMGKWN